MSILLWTKQLENGLERMDATHREFVEHYNIVAKALTGAQEDFLAAYDSFVAHTEAHFAQENRWMEAVDFPPCHRGEHERVLAVLRAVRKRAVDGDLFLARRLVDELPQWFDGHTNGMDAALAFHIDSVGYDVVTGEFKPKAEASAESSAGSSAALPSASPEPAEHG
jgi:hemerythrin-like metal-binding protein